MRATQAKSRLDLYNTLPTWHEKMILYPYVSPFRNFLNFLAANGFSIGRRAAINCGLSRRSFEKIGCEVARSAQDHDQKGAKSQA